VGDTALHVTTTMLDGSAVVTVTRGLELGVRYTYAASSWSAQSAAGTPPLPSHDALMGFGPEFHGAIGFGRDNEFMLGFAGNLLAYRIPTAAWARSTTCAPGPHCYDAVGPVGTAVPVRYELHDQNHTDRLALNVGIFASEMLPGRKYGQLFATLNFNDAFENVGFTDQAGGPALHSAGFIPLLGFGYGLASAGFRASALVSYAFTTSNSPVQYGFPVFVLAVGADIPLWHATD
jgi:hypothetical protein